jgi:outer membrane protein assembly factor BamB
MWKSAVPGGDQAGYASITILESDGSKQYVQFLQKGIVGIAAQDGKFLWRYDKPAQGSPANIPTPVTWKNYVYAGSGRGGGALVKLNVENGRVEPEPVYSTPKAPTAIGGALKIGENLYGTAQALLCLDFMTGKLKWENRAIGAASLLFADGLLYLHGENGEVALVEATPEGYRQKGRFTPPNAPERGAKKAWAYPALANGRLYIRDEGVLWCFDVKAK